MLPQQFAHVHGQLRCLALSKIRLGKSIPQTNIGEPLVIQSITYFYPITLYIVQLFYLIRHT